LLCLIWGSSYLFIRIGLRGFTPISLVALRLVVGAAVTGTIAALRRTPIQVPGRTLLFLVVLSTVNTTVPFLLITFGETVVPSGLASVLNSVVPIFSVVLAGLVLNDEPMTASRLAGVGLGFLGVLVLLSRDLNHGGSSHALLGQGAIILSSLCYAVGAVFARRLLRGVPSLTIAVWVLVISATESVALSGAVSRPPLTDMRMQSVFAVLWLGVLGSGVAYMLAYYVLAALGASRYTLVSYVLPAVGLTLGIIFLGESLDWRILAGSALVITGIVFASLMRVGPRSVDA
jgi:drug/metabolite transporter (DMT)-like permease